MKKIIVTLLIMSCALVSHAFTASQWFPLPYPANGYRYFFDVEAEYDGVEYALNEKTKEAVAVWEGLFSHAPQDRYSYEVEIPEKILDDAYTVVAVYMLRLNLRNPLREWVKDVTLPSTAKYVLMLDIPGVESVTIPEGAQWLGGFRTYAGEALELPASVREVDYSFLSNAANLRSFKMGAIEKIGPSTLYGCRALEELDLGTRLAVLAKGSFSRLNSLTQVVIPESVEKIEDRVFSDCPSLKTVTLPSHPVEMGEAFTNMAAQETGVVACESPYEISRDAFQGADVEKCIVYVPKGCGAKYKKCPGWSRFRISEDSPAGATAVMEENTPAVYYDLAGRCVTSPASGQMLICRKGNTATKVIIP